MSIDKLNADNINLNNYVEILQFAMTCAEFFDNLGDMKFINTLPLTQNEFSNLHHTTRQRFVNLIKGHIDYFDNLESRIVQGKVAKLEIRRQESIKRLVANHQREIDIFKKELMYGLDIPEPQSTSEPEPKPVSPPVADNEKAAMVNVIKKLSHKLKAQSLMLQRGRPNKKQMKHHIDDGCRKRNGKCNNEAVGRKLGIDGETAKRWIEDLGLSNYAYNPNHIETFHRKKK